MSDTQDTEPKPHPFVDLAYTGTDYRDMGPVLDCPCGCNMIYLLTMLDPETRDVGMYFTDGLCAKCCSLVKVATPVDDVQPWPGLFTEEDYLEPSGDEAAEAARLHAQVAKILKDQEQTERELREQAQARDVSDE